MEIILQKIIIKYEKYINYLKVKDFHGIVSKIAKNKREYLYKYSLII
jgi:hypothetical protein